MTSPSMPPESMGVKAGHNDPPEQSRARILSMLAEAEGLGRKSVYLQCAIAIEFHHHRSKFPPGEWGAEAERFDCHRDTITNFLNNGVYLIDLIDNSTIAEFSESSISALFPSYKSVTHAANEARAREAEERAAKAAAEKRAEAERRAEKAAIKCRGGRRSPTPTPGSCPYTSPYR